MINKIEKTRVTIIFFIFLVLYSMVVGNLFFIQIYHRAFYTELGHQQYDVIMTTPPARAPILDRHGKELALNKDSFAAFILPKKITDKKALVSFLHKHFPAAVDRLKKAETSSYFMYVKRNLSPEQITLIKESGMCDIQLLKEPARYYPIHAAGIITGFTDIDNKGLCGLEMSFNDRLAGKPTTYELCHDARSGHFYFKKETKIAGKEGEPIKLTIDGNLQFLVHEELQETINTFNAKEGAVVVLNPKTGELLAAASFPDFNPNDVTQLNLADSKNKILTESFELGSVIKVFAALAAFEEGLVEEEELIDCENKATTWVEGRRINTMQSSVAGIIPFTRVIEKSNNIGTAKVAMRVGPKIYDHYTKIGFGRKTGINFPGEQKGFVNHPDNWSKQSIISLSYGYEISGTLLQLAQAFAVIANDGILVPPYLVIDPKQPHPISQERLYSQRALDIIKRVLENTTLRGTTKKAGIKGYKVLSKTGTANLLINGLYDNTKNIYTCAGIVEKDGYQRVIVVFVKEAQKKNLYASTVAAPLFERVAEKMLINDMII